MKSKKYLLSLVISLALLCLLLWKVDVKEVWSVLRGTDWRWFAGALLLFAPQTWAIAMRWQMIAQPVAPISLVESWRQIMASNCLNLVLPSKMGDLAKGVFLYRQGHCRLDEGLHIVVFEKLLDLASLSAWMMIGWLILRPKGAWIFPVLALGAVLVVGVAVVYFTPWGARLAFTLLPGKVMSHPKLAKVRGLLDSGPRVMALVHATGARRAAILAWSLGIWFLHLAQIFCFFKCLGATVTPLGVFAVMPIAIFAGLMPLSIAGVGVRDWALVTLFTSPENPPALLVGVGLLVSLRYVVPAMGGVPFVSHYFLMSREAAAAKALNEEST